MLELKMNCFQEIDQGKLKGKHKKLSVLQLKWI